jgi:hypothetical protein
MPAWKAAFTLVFGILCLGLACGAFIAPLALTTEENRWPWCGGLLLGAILMTTLFVLFLRSADRAFMGPASKHNP